MPTWSVSGSGIKCHMNLESLIIGLVNGLIVLRLKVVFKQMAAFVLF